ncbi:hypothetical protein NDU88_008371 [Pleurodeles waltl]|uniref:Uncharacterized protein n=1 Tax=Pleurodeles waltl TaxID=8319 RepID=A0AAV7RVJ3_PLEWA|nr:hypothetical protein NDU88_008371 [Pleurodeles waltl]
MYPVYPTARGEDAATMYPVYPTAKGEDAATMYPAYQTAGGEDALGQHPRKASGSLESCFCCTEGDLARADVHGRITRPPSCFPKVPPATYNS